MDEPHAQKDPTPPLADDVGHVPVLPGPVLELLAPKPGGVFVDCTTGRGGHASLVIPHLGPGGTYLAFDLDPGNLAYARQRCEPIAQAHGVTLHTAQENFAGLRPAMDRLGVERADALLADLGFASNQVDDAARGLSFKQDGPLDMRLDPSGPVTAEQLVNTLPERELADLIYRLGEERLSRRIARKIVAQREIEPISRTLGLAKICRSAYGHQPRGVRIDPATRTFQALRIAVNGELDALDRLLGQLAGVLASGGRAGLISFHSLEDRPVKRAFLQAQQDGWAKRLTRKPVVADVSEQTHNPRSRSAKFRVIERLSLDHPPTVGGDRREPRPSLT
ncbi:MAG: 16S rRNA (cytosine(1402)-N(4))-methyltransferase RsmH [Phycisphaerales bacterium JB063]